MEVPNAVPNVAQTVVNNNKNIASSIEADDGELEGTPVLSPDQQQELVEAAAPVGLRGDLPWWK